MKILTKIKIFNNFRNKIALNVSNNQLMIISKNLKYQKMKKTMIQTIKIKMKNKKCVKMIVGMKILNN